MLTVTALKNGSYLGGGKTSCNSPLSFNLRTLLAQYRWITTLHVLTEQMRLSTQMIILDIKFEDVKKKETKQTNVQCAIHRPKADYV